jgi:hypothetical protein
VFTGAGARVVLVVGSSAHIMAHLQGSSGTGQGLANHMLANVTAMTEAIGAAAVLHAEVEGAMCKVC